MQLLIICYCLFPPRFFALAAPLPLLDIVVVVVPVPVPVPVLVRRRSANEMTRVCGVHF